MLELTLKCGTVRYLDQGAGEPLLLIHGFPLDHTMWQKQLAPLAKSFRLIVPDLPGFGRSVRSQPLRSLKDFADELSELLDHLQIQQVSFCGLSMGGYIGWQFWKHHAARLQRLIACNTRAAADSETVARSRRISAESVRSDGVAKLAEGMLGRMFAPRNLDLQTTEVKLIRDSMLRAHPESVAQSLEAMAIREDATPWLQQITVPTLFVAGEYDEITPPDEMRANSALVPGSQFVEVADVGHLSPLENPQAFSQAIQEFMNDTN